MPAMGVQGALLPRVQQGSPTEVLRVPQKHQDVVRVQKVSLFLFLSYIVSLFRAGQSSLLVSCFRRDLEMKIEVVGLTPQTLANPGTGHVTYVGLSLATYVSKVNRPPNCLQLSSLRRSI